MKKDFDEFVIYMQKFIDENMKTKSILVKAESKAIENKMDALDWAVRFSEFISSQELQQFFFYFRELYAHPDA